MTTHDIVGKLTLAFLPQHLGRHTFRVFSPTGASTPTTQGAQEKEYFLQALEMAGGNRTEAAKILGIDRVSLWRKLKRRVGAM